jgi:hypothetical protein
MIIIIIIKKKVALVCILEPQNKHFFRYVPRSKFVEEILTALIQFPGLALFLVFSSIVTICVYCTLTKLRACPMLAIRLPYLRLCIKSNFIFNFDIRHHRGLFFLGSTRGSRYTFLIPVDTIK